MSDLEIILSKLHRVRQSGRGWIARCPAHEDRSPSLSVCQQDGRILLHCFAGCTTEAVCVALGVRVSDLFPSPRTALERQPPALRAARRVASEGLRHHPRSVREEPVTIIFTNAADIDIAIARALALTVEGELCQIALKEP